MLLPVIFPVFQPFSPDSSVCYCLKKHLISASETEAGIFLLYKKRGGREEGRKEGRKDVGEISGEICLAPFSRTQSPVILIREGAGAGGRERGNIRRELR